MFSVPGWSVHADSLKTQVESPNRASVKPTNTSAHGPGSEHANTSKKRKRGHARPDNISITSENLADLWEKHIEGTTEKRINGREATADRHQRGNKKRREEAGKDLDVDPKASTGIGEAGKKDSKATFEKRKTLKEKKREKKALLQAAGDLPPPRPAAQQPLDITLEDGSQKERRIKAEAISMPSISDGFVDPTENGSIPPAKPPVNAPANTPISTLTPLQRTMRDKLTSARFRHLNQTLYTTPSSHSLSLFTQNPTFFSEYHEGFRRQVGVWPENPVESFIRDIRARALIRGTESQKARFRQEKKRKGKKQLEKEQPETTAEAKAGLDPLPRTDGVCTVADLGCGDAHLAASLSGDLKKFKVKILSYDLAAPNPLVTQADIKDLPLKDGSVDIAVFCLALMGTNWIDFVEEAWRVLKWKGELWVAEIRSRFGKVGKGVKGRVEHSVGNKVKGNTDKKKKKAEEEKADEEVAVIEIDEGGDLGRGAETDVAAFVEVLRKRGFVLKGQADAENKMFVRMRFLKALTPIKGKGTPPKNDRGGDRWKAKERAKFVENDEDTKEEDEAKVLKPCVYKVR